MEPTRISLRARRATMLVTVAAAAALVIPSAAGAAVTGAANGDTATLTGDLAADNIVIGFDGTNLTHNLGTASGFTSGTDFDSTVAGEQKLTTAGTLTINGGDGDDNIVGSKNADHLIGGAGSDRITGFTGGDDVDGGEGNDLMIWNNGDGTDDMNGEDGLDRIENNLGAADDVSQVKVLNGKVRYDRVNAPFGLSIATSEVFELNTFGGNDTLDVQPGVGALIAIVADAGSGNDRFNGGDENDTFFGGLGDDTLEPGAGFDSVDGQDGNDRLLVRDNTGDLARGGTGTDSAVADAADVLAEIESADVTPAADTRATTLRVISKRITSKIKRGIYTARVRVECPAVETGGCRGTLSLLTAKSLRSRGVTLKAALLGSKSYRLRPGQRRTLAIKLPRGIGKFADSKRRLSLRAQSVSRDAAGNVATRASKLTVKLVK